MGEENRPRRPDPAPKPTAVAWYQPSAFWLLPCYDRKKTTPGGSHVPFPRYDCVPQFSLVIPREEPRRQRYPAHAGSDRRKHIQAIGGIDKLKAIQSVTISGKAVLMGGQLEAPIAMRVKRPGSMRMEFTVQDKSYIQAFDGTTAWTINPFMGSPDPQKSNDEDTALAQDDADAIEGAWWITRPRATPWS